VGVVAAALIGYKVIDALLHAVVPPDRGICVFPPAVTEGGGDSQGIVDAFAEDLILDLGSVQAIHVVASQTAFASRQRSTRPERLAQAFGAGYYLVWTLAVREEHLSGSVTLMDTLHPQPVGRRRWSPRC
jgi:TolB-like protein